MPATWNAAVNLSNTTSSSLASSKRAACLRACSTSSLDAWCTAAPPCCNEREPMVPPPVGTASVSPHTTSIMSIAIPVSSLANIDHEVTWPCPCGDVPVYTIARPFGRISTLPYSPDEVPAVISTYTLMPMPSCLVLPLARRAAWSLRSCA